MEVAVKSELEDPRENQGKVELGGWWFQILYFLFSPLPGEDSHLD